MNKYHSLKIGDLNIIENISDYNAEAVEHLVDQLIKLQKASVGKPYEQGKDQLHKAMRNINKSLEKELEVVEDNESEPG